MSVQRAEAAAKVNLALAVTGLRDDGYHTLRSVFVRLTLHDELEVTEAPPDAGDSLVVDGPYAVPVEHNLVLRAVSHLREVIGEGLPPLHFRLTKRVPAAAGLGGGSSDAATAMDLALMRWGVRLHPAERHEAALRIGADVPFFSAGHSAALVHGIGEGLQPLPAPAPPAGLLLITPTERLSTEAVFAELDRQPPSSRDAVAEVDALAGLLREVVDGGTLASTAAQLRDANDLWLPASQLSPSLTAARESCEAALGGPVMFTGSGPTLFAVYPSEAAASRAADQLQWERLAELEDATVIATSTSPNGGRS